MKTWLVTVLLLVSGPVLFADIAITGADNGKTLTAKVGELITVSLKGNPTTGYSWTEPQIAGDFVQAAGKVEYKTDKHPNGMVGVGGMFTVKLKAVKSGQAVVTMEYRRPWEKDQPAAQTFKVTIAVAK